MTTDIISAWIDEEELRRHAASLLAPVQPIEDFMLIDSESVQNTSQQEQTDLLNERDQFQSLTQHCPPIVESKVRLNAVNALKRAAAESDVGANRFGKVEGIDEEKGWESSGGTEDQPTKVQAAVQQNIAQSKSIGSLEKVQSELSEVYQCQQVCIFDRDGDIFVNTLKNQGVAKLMVQLTELIRKSDINKGTETERFFHLKVAAKEIIQIVVTSTSHGLLIVGMLRAAPLSSVEASELINKIQELV